MSHGFEIDYLRDILTRLSKGESAAKIAEEEDVDTSLINEIHSLPFISKTEEGDYTVYELNPILDSLLVNKNGTGRERVYWEFHFEVTRIGIPRGYTVPKGFDVYKNQYSVEFEEGHRVYIKLGSRSKNTVPIHKLYVKFPEHAQVIKNIGKMFVKKGHL